MNRTLVSILTVMTLALLSKAAWAAQPAENAPSATTQPAASAPAPQPLTVLRTQVNDRGITVATLSNQLTVIIQENHNAPVACTQVFVRTGGMFEGRWLGDGLSHLLEHLVAKEAVHDSGAAGSKPAQPTTGGPLDAIGGQSNAYTSADVTTYFINVTAAHAGEAVDILADWIVHPSIAPDDFRREHGVVQRELEMGRDEVTRQLYYAHWANFYRDHPAAVPTIGYLPALREVTYEDVLEYHRQRYVPQNMVLVVVGDVDASAMLARAEKAFAGFEPGPSAAPVLPEVPYLAGVRRVVVANPAVKDVAEEMSFRTIPLVHEDLYPLDLLSFVLSQGESSRLYRSVLRDKQLVTSISTSSDTPYWGAGQFMVSFRCENGKADAAEQEIFAQLRRVRQEGVTEEELAKAKRQKVADYVYGQQSVESQASTLANDYISTGDVDFSRKYTDRIQSVTPEQVQQAARKYFDLGAMAITRMVAPTAEAAQTATATAAAASGPTRFTLPNGLTVVLSPSNTVDLVSMNLVVLGGVLAETPQTNGMGTLVTQLSLKGAGARSAEDIASFFDRSGGSIEAQNGNNSFVWSATVLKDDWSGALDILSDVIIRPTFPQKELGILRPELVSSIQHVEEDWSSQMQHFFREKFFGDSPYHMLTLGSAEVVEKATPDAIAAYQRKWIRAGSAVLTVYGRFDPEQARAQVEKLFADMPAGKNELPIPAPRKVKDGGEQYVLPTHNEVAAIDIGWPGLRITDAKDRDAMTVLQTIISGFDMPRGWLHEDLRGARLVYVVHAVNMPGWAPGAFFVYAATQPPQAREVIDVIRRDIAKTLTHEWTKEEMDQAVNIILTSELLNNQTMANLSLQAALDELYGFGYDYRKSLESRLRAVTAADLHRVAEKYLAGPAVTTVTTPEPGVVEGTK